MLQINPSPINVGKRTASSGREESGFSLLDKEVNVTDDHRFKCLSSKLVRLHEKENNDERFNCDITWNGIVKTFYNHFQGTREKHLYFVIDRDEKTGGYYIFNYNLLFSVKVVSYLKRGTCGFKRLKLEVNLIFQVHSNMLNILQLLSQHT